MDIIELRTDAKVAPYTLVIVDMQENFPAAKDKRTIAGVAEEILQAMALNLPIVFIITNGFGNIIPELLALVQEHAYSENLWTIETKCFRPDVYYSDSSGGKQVDEACEVFEFPTSRFRICGVNTEVCVFFTAMELAQKYTRSLMEIVLKACNSQWNNEPIGSFIYYARQHQFTNYVLETECA